MKYHPGGLLSMEKEKGRIIMAKFCKYCGRKLEEGEICVCQQKPAENAAASEQAGAGTASGQPGNADVHVQHGVDPAGDSAQPGGRGIDSEWINKQKQVFVSGTKSALGEIRPILRQPVSRVREVSLTGDGCLGKELIIGKAVVFMVVALAALMILSGRIDDMGYGFVDVEMPYLQVMLAVLVLTAGVDFVEAFILKAISGAFGGVTSSNAMMNVVGARGIFDTLIMLASVIVGLMAIEMAYLVLVVLISLSSIMELAIYQGTVVQMDENKKPYAFFLAKLCLMVIVFIVTYLLVRSAMDSVVGSALRYMM